jgi:hypothetical protein
MSRPRRYHTRQQQARQRRREKARERLQREQARAQRHLWAFEPAIQDLGLPETVAEEVNCRLQAQQQLLDNICGIMFPPGVWVPQLPRAVPGERLEQEPARPDLGSAAQARVAQASAAPGPGAVDTAMAAGRPQKPDHP